MSHTLPVEPKAPVDSKGAAIDERLERFKQVIQYESRKSEIAYIDKDTREACIRNVELAKQETAQAILAILAQEVKRARIDELKELQMADTVDDLHKDYLYMAYISDRIKDLERLG